MVRYATCATLLVALLGGSLRAQSSIQVLDGTTNIPNNTGSVSLGTVAVGFYDARAGASAPGHKLFTVRNTGASNLTLGEPIALPQGYTLVRTFGRTTVPPNQTTTFEVALNSASAGRKSGMVSFRTNDTAANPFRFTVNGGILGQPSLKMVNDGDPAAAYTTTGSWSQFSGYGLQSDASIATGAYDGSSAATYNFTGLEPGEYQVAVTFPAYSDWASQAPYTVLDGTTSIGTVRVNQQVAPNDFVDGAVGWTRLGTFRITGNRLQVRVAAQADAGGFVIADGVRIERVGWHGGIVDNNDLSYATFGPWTAFTGAGYFNNDGAYIVPGVGNNYALWYFPNLAPGNYRVSATWAPLSYWAPDAPFTVMDEVYGELATVRLNQRVAPNDFTDAGRGWKDIGAVGTVYPVFGNSLIVFVTDNASDLVAADAVRIERVDDPVTPSVADSVRFLEQATWGPNDASVQRVRTIGMAAWLTEQMTSATSGYPTLPVVPNNNADLCPAGTAGDICRRDNYQIYPLQVRFFRNALYQNDQLRQRVFWALHKFLVVSGRADGLVIPSRLTPYLQLLDRNAFGDGQSITYAGAQYPRGNFRTMLLELTLNPAMGFYLDMRLSTLTRPNENYARELLQLFAVGLDEMHPDGTFKLNGTARIPTYNQPLVENFTRALTGWVFGPNITPPGGVGVATNYRDRLVLSNNGAQHYFANPRPTLFGGFQLPAGRSGIAGAEEDMRDTLDNVFNHANVGPFVSTLLIQSLVTSNPSPGYVARVAACFDNNGAGVRGDMQATVRAILLDPEARGDLKTRVVSSQEIYGKQREPVQLIVGLMRAFGVTAYSGTGQSDGVIEAQANNLDQSIFRPQSVFSYFSPETLVPETTDVRGPEFEIFTSLTTLRRHNYVNLMTQPSNGNPATYGIVAAPPNTPDGTKLNLSGLQALATQDPSGAALVNELNRVMLHGAMSSQMRTAVLTAVAHPNIVNNPLRQAKVALYLVATSPEYNVQR